MLALSVVAGHGAFWHPFFFVVPGAAVVAFFIVSGFYMALVIDETYGTDWRAFMLNRALRLYPAYIVFTVMFGTFLAWRGRLNTDPLALVLDVTLIGQDWLHSLMASHVVTRYGTDDVIHVIPIAQAWSVALELQLYLVAAFCFRSVRGIVAVFAAGVVLKLACKALGITGHPLDISLLPNVLVFFGLGGLGYLVYRRLEVMASRARATIAASLAAALLADCYVFGGFWPAGTPAVGIYGFYVLVAALVPFLFSFTKNSQLDRAIGELSYPVYLAHIMVFAWAAELGVGKWFVLVATLAVSAAVMLLVEYPVGRLRHSIGRTRQRRVFSLGRARS